MARLRLVLNMIDKTGRQLSQKEIIDKSLNRISVIALELQNFLLQVIGHVPSHIIRRFFYRLAGIRIGHNSTIHTGARFYNPQNIKIGIGTIVGENAVLDGRDKLIIGDHVDIATDVMIYNSWHDIEDPDFSALSEPVIIGDYVFVGPRAIILPGVKIGKGAIVAAGSVVTKNVEEFDVVGGVPAKVIKQRGLRELHYKLGRATWFR